ncbi:hypothetical protein NYO91_18095 [Arhodomonas aquaeolei]|uniref:hypothetical protein n=1 Tax=Arhodomonas aquaeolei TaxID=2369 RepID=UPI002169E9E3|nr:hypothetical protein [Arhodomonas aquaeolei]MCS4505995.1 hypothetical protein [Arhodomonas aquaeolei]
MKFHSTPPKKVNLAVRKIAQHLDLDADEARLLKFHHPKEFKPEPQNCFFNVWARMKFSGGDKQHGWLIAQDVTKDFIEAQFHAVWVSSEGKFIDVTPRIDGERRVMFIPDYAREIQLSSSNGHPAILTYDNFRVLQGEALTQLEPIRAVIHDTSFIEEHRLSWV